MRPAAAAVPVYLAACAVPDGGLFRAARFRDVHLYQGFAEAVFDDIPQPGSAVDDHVDLARSAQPAAAGLGLHLRPEVDGLGVRGTSHHILLNQ